MARQNKFEYLHIVQGNYGYGHGWEDVYASEDRTDARERLKEYRENEGRLATFRLIMRRVPVTLNKAA